MQGLPHSADAEREVLGAVLLRADMAPKLVEAGLRPQDFHLERNQLVCRAVLDLVELGTPVDPATIRERLLDRKEWNRAGEFRTLSELMDKGAVTGAFEHMCDVVKKYALRRLLVSHGWDVSKMGLESDDPEISLEKAHTGLREIAESGNLHTGVTMRDGVRGYMDYINRVQAGEITDTRLPTGIRSLDDHLGGGLRTGWQVVVMSAAGHGKTAFAVNNLALSAAKAGHPVVICSLEMQPKEVIGRMVAAESGVPVHVHDRAGLDPYDLSRLMGAADQVYNLPIRIIGARHGNIESITSVARQVKAQYGSLGMVVVDYLQLMKSTDNAEASSEEKISTNSGALKLLANELDCVSVVLSQPVLSAKRDKKRPSITQAKGSGSIEDDADLALIPWLPFKVDDTAPRSNAEMGMDKFRHGPQQNLSSDELRWNGKNMRFEQI